MNLLHDQAPEAKEAFISAVEPDPCSILMFGPGFLAQMRDLQGSISVPVLLLFGQESALWVSNVTEHEAAEYSSSPDVTTKEIAGAGHLLMFERAAPAFRTELSIWLTERGF